MIRLAGMVVLAAILVGCGSKSPDYKSLWTTSSSTSAEATTGSAPEPLSAYLKRLGVSGDQVDPGSLPDLTVSMPTPAGWVPYVNPHFTKQTVAIHKGESYPLAMLMAFKLSGDFNPTDVVQHSFVDAEMQEEFKKLDSSTADFHGFPSGMIQGSYTLLGQRLHSYNRIVVATGSGADHPRYLVQFTVTTVATQAVAQSDDVEAIIKGFTVAAK